MQVSEMSRVSAFAKASANNDQQSQSLPIKRHCVGTSNVVLGERRRISVLNKSLASKDLNDRSHSLPIPFNYQKFSQDVSRHSGLIRRYDDSTWEMYDRIVAARTMRAAIRLEISRHAVADGGNISKEGVRQAAEIKSTSTRQKPSAFKDQSRHTATLSKDISPGRSSAIKSEERSEDICLFQIED